MVYSQCVLFPEKGCLQHYNSHHPQTKINTRYGKSFYRNSCTHLIYLWNLLASVEKGLGRSDVYHLVCLAKLVKTCTFDRILVQCETLNEEELFDIQEQRGLFQLGWIHVSYYPF